MKVYATRDLPTYQKIGPYIRIHWDEKVTEKEINSEKQIQYSYEEVVVSEFATIEDVFRLGVPAEIANNFTIANFVEETN